MRIEIEIPVEAAELIKLIELMNYFKAKEISPSDLIEFVKLVRPALSSDAELAELLAIAYFMPSRITDYSSTSFDTFLCHNNTDKQSVRKLAEQLRENGLKPWLDEEQLRPGLPWQRLLEHQIKNIKSAIVFVGKDGIGPWQHQELDAFLREFIDRGCPVIPVILEYAPSVPELPIFLKGMTWVDFRQTNPDPISRLIWGITGNKNLNNL